ncbi:hypothetical protein ACT6NV_00495 [Robiginitalea sp. IMCC44478]|uniref:hypothetical protein n=1 Tax=Robiginitalea sp. IMCC44478 TaxID=3459122 RepID=UPI0040434470
MKTTKQIVLLAIGASCFFMQWGHAQTERIITLYVNTAEIQNPDVNASCNFGQTDGSSNEDYTISANVDDIIVWKGVALGATETSSVEIVAINHQGANGGRDVFGGDNRLTADDGEVRGTIVTTTEPGTDYKYKISFRVIHEGESKGGIFQIDPKIKVN